MASKVNCPTCGRRVVWCSESEYRPFCCERCRLIDLGEWVTETYVLVEQEGSLPDPT